MVPVCKSTTKRSPRKKSRPNKPSTVALGGSVWQSIGKFLRDLPKISTFLTTIRGVNYTPLPVVTWIRSFAEAGS